MKRIIRRLRIFELLTGNFSNDTVLLSVKLEPKIRTRQARGAIVELKSELKTL